MTATNDIISRADDDLIRQHPEKLLSQIEVRAYSSSSGAPSRRGVQLVNVDPELGRRFGFRAGDVILELNGIPVTSRAAAIDVGTELSARGDEVPHPHHQHGAGRRAHLHRSGTVT